MGKAQALTGVQQRWYNEATEPKGSARGVLFERKVVSDEAQVQKSEKVAKAETITRARSARIRDITGTKGVTDDQRNRESSEKAVWTAKGCNAAYQDDTG